MRTKTPMILQGENSECAMACVAMVAAYYGQHHSMNSIRQTVGSITRGTSVADLMALANQMQLHARPVKLELDELGHLQCPAILHWNFNHFVVLTRVGRRHIIVNDPATGTRRYTLQEAGDRFTGIGIELNPRKDFQQRKEAPASPLLQYLPGTPAVFSSLAQILAISVAIQLFALAAPFYVQLVVDDVLTKADSELLTVLALGFAALSIITVTAKFIRGWTGLYLSQQMSYLMASNVFHHLIRLPLAFFSRRHMGDIVSRFESLKPVQAFISSAGIVVIVDGLLATTTVVLMFLYSSMLGWIVVTASAIFALFRWLQYGLVRRREHEAIVAEAKLDSFFLETVRGVASLRQAAAEPARSLGWRQIHNDTLNTQMRLGGTNLTCDAISGILTGLEYVLIVYIAAGQVIASTMTIGMVYAFLAYRSHFSAAMTSLINQFMAYKMLGLHLERLEDLTGHDVDQSLADNSAFRIPIAGALSADKLSFGHGQEANLFDNCSLFVRQGEWLALTGPSGVGKTSLLNLLMGLAGARSGTIAVDGQRLNPAFIPSLRDASAAVTAMDQLFSGSLRDNINFFATAPNEDHLIDAAISACIHNEIMDMPMGYETRVGDMGATLSTGQMQRVLLARALYRQPALLFLDEGTSHVDATTERQIMRNIRHLGMTCIFISHNPLITQLADHQLVFDSDGSTQFISEPGRAAVSPPATIPVMSPGNPTQSEERS